MWSLNQAEALHVVVVRELEMTRTENGDAGATLMAADEGKEVAERGSERAEELEMRMKEIEDERQV